MSGLHVRSKRSPGLALPRGVLVLVAFFPLGFTFVAVAVFALVIVFLRGRGMDTSRFFPIISAILPPVLFYEEFVELTHLLSFPNRGDTQSIVHTFDAPDMPL
jgi:hypothetical protein